MIAHWNHFWFSKDSSQVLCLLRIFFGFTLLQKMTHFHRFFITSNWRVYFPWSLIRKEKDWFMEDFRLPVPGFEWLPVPSYEMYHALETMVLVLCVFFILGLFTRVVAPLLAGTYGYLFLLSQFTYSHHIFLFVLVLSVLAFAPINDHYSLDAYLFRTHKPAPKRSVLPTRMLQILVCFLYGFTTLAKHDVSWFNGQFMEGLYTSGRMDGLLAPAAPIIGFQFFGLSTLVIEGLLAFGLMVPRLRRLSWFLGIALHVGIDTMMDVSTYSYQMMALYILFIAPVSGETVILYDGRDPGSTRRRRLWGLLDWLRRFTCIDVATPAGQSAAQGLSGDVLQTGWAVVTPDGEIQQGYDAWHALAVRTPLLFMVAWPLGLPGARAIGETLFTATNFSFHK